MPVYDAQAIPDSTDYSILAAADEGYGVVANDSVRSAPVVSVCTQTCTNTNTTALSTLTGSASLTVSSSSGLPPAGYGYVPTSGGGSAYISWTGGGGGGSTLTGVFYISGGSGNITAGATITSVFALSVAAGFVMNNGVPASVAAQAISLQNFSGSAFQALPPQSGDRKDMLVSTTAGVLSIVQGVACPQLDWTRNNGSYTNAAPVKAAWASATPIVLTEIYLPGTGSTHYGTPNTLVAGNLTDKSVPTIYPNLTDSTVSLGSDATLTTSMATVLTSGSLQPGTYLMVGAMLASLSTVTSTAEVNWQFAAGTATVGGLTIIGQGVGETTLLTTATNTTAQAMCPIAVIFNVSAAGTVVVQAKTSAGTVKIKATTPTGGLGNSLSGPSGVTILRIN